MINNIRTYNNFKSRQAFGNIAQKRLERIEKQGIEDGKKGVCNPYLQNNKWNEDEMKSYINGYNTGMEAREDNDAKYLSDGIIKFTEETGLINYNLAHLYAIKNL